MRAGRLVVAVSSAVVVGTCVSPTERDASVHVSITPIQVLFRGSDTVARASAWQMTGPADSQPIVNVVFTWSSSDPSVATVDRSGHIVGVKSGTVVIRVAAANFDKQSLAASNTLRVAAPLEIDSVRPKIALYGQILSIYGIGADSIVSAALAGAALIRGPYSDTAFPGGTERSKWWVPPPARSDTLFFLGISGANGVFGYYHGDTTAVVERDLFEPDDTVPHAIDLDAPPPFAVAPTLVFFNPALAFEVLPRGTVTGADWYRFSQAATRDVTFILTAPQLAGTYATYVTDSLGWNTTTHQFFIGKNSWTFGPGSHACHGLGFKPSQAAGDSTIVAFKSLPGGTLDALALYSAPGRYGLRVVAGYQSELPPDARENDNSCDAADLSGVLTPPFRDTLAIENPHDVDWMRVHLTAAPLLGTSYQFRLHAFPGVHADSLKDLDLYVIKVPQPADVSLQVVLADTAPGSDVNRATTITTTADYYVAVVDYAGTATTYEICIGTNPALGAVFCNTNFPSPPASAPRRASRPAAALASPLVPSGP